MLIIYSTLIELLTFFSLADSLVYASFIFAGLEDLVLSDCYSLHPGQKLLQSPLEEREESQFDFYTLYSNHVGIRGE
jgi:hypothetical protein